MKFQPHFKVFLTIMSVLCSCYREASQISRVSTQSACYPAASTTGPTWGRWPHPLYTRVSSGLSWKSRLWCRKNRCVHVFCKHFHCDHKTRYVFHHIPHCTGHWENAVLKCSRLFESGGFCLCVCVYKGTVWIRCNGTFWGQNAVPVDCNTCDYEHHK